MASPWARPMLARNGSGRDAPRGPGWVYERKLDGIRVGAERHGGTVSLWSRNALPLDRRFPGVVAALAAVGVDDFVLDGEVVAFDGERTSFGLLQRGGAVSPPVLCAFDLLRLLGSDIRDLPLLERKALLAELLGEAEPLEEAEPLGEAVPLGDGAAPADGRIRLVGHVAGAGDELLAAACRDRWEGLVAKRAGSAYRAGRSPDWRKLKCRAGQELVVGGWTDPGGARQGLGALAVGYHDASGLRYAGRVGTGFDERELRALGALLAERSQPTPPFVDPPRRPPMHWVRADLVVAVEFTEWTADGQLRHPSYLGRRDDKPAAEVVRET